MQKSFVFGAALYVSSVLAAPAIAADGSTSEGAQLQAGPGIEYPEVMRLAPNLTITIHGCARAWDWCDVEWRGNRGWAPAHTLAYHVEDRLLPVAGYKHVGVPEVEFNLAEYWEAHYRQRPWYPDRKEWSSRAYVGAALAEAVN